MVIGINNSGKKVLNQVETGKKVTFAQVQKS